MNKPLAGASVAILVANGFCEQDMTETQRALITAGAAIRVISMDHALVNGWHGTGWGHHFAVDSALSAALAADYDMLVVPGGRRSLEKLKLTAHTRRFIGGFIAAKKPVALCGRALQLGIFADQIKSKKVSGPVEIMEDVTRAGAEWSEDALVLDGNLLTGQTETHRAEFVETMIALFADHVASLPKAA